LNRANVTAHTGLSGPLALAAAIAVGVVAVLAPLPAPAAPNAACTQALEYEKTASTDSVTRQAAYDSAVAGLAANQRCTDAQMKLVNEAYLLSMRAPAEHDLHIGNWQRDFDRANMLLMQCAGWPGLRGTKAGNDCATQRQYNQQIAKSLAAQPSPRPSAGAMPGSPQPSPYRTVLPLPQPASPMPSPTPRR
jgi:hypothetical protein